MRQLPLGAAAAGDFSVSERNTDLNDFPAAKLAKTPPEQGVPPSIATCGWLRSPKLTMKRPQQGQQPDHVRSHEQSPLVRSFTRCWVVLLQHLVGVVVGCSTDHMNAAVAGTAMPSD